jgi:hypothetical protein
MRVLKEIKWEAIQLNSSQRVPLPEGILEVRFFFNQSQLASETVSINNTFVLQAFNVYTNAEQMSYPYELILINNENEIDKTEYYVKMTTGSVLSVFYKYFGKPRI